MYYDKVVHSDNDMIIFLMILSYLWILLMPYLISNYFLSCVNNWHQKLIQFQFYFHVGRSNKETGMKRRSFQNKDICPNSHDFIAETYNLSHLIKSSIGRLYDILYQALCLKHPSRVKNHFSKIIKEAKENLINKANLHKNLLNYRNKNNLGDS